jgi:outer membrane protein OmpA-like peptidoglycan-associated protein
MRSVCLWGLIGVSAPALAADVDPYSASGSMPHKSGSPSTESPALTNGGLSAGLTATLARNLATYDFANGTSRQLAPEVFTTTLYGGWTFEDKLRIELLAPISPRARTGSVGDSFRGAGLRDLLLQGNVRLFENESGTFGASVIPTLGVPTGRPAAYLARGPHLRLRGAVGGEVAERFGYTANAGFILSPGDLYQDVAHGSTVDVAGAAWVHLDKSLRVGADYEQRFGVSNAPGRRNVIGWTHLFAQVVRDDGLGLSVAGGRGTYQGVGAPEWRVQAAITWSPRTRDTDRDGIVDRDDLCPLDPEDLDGFEDGDGCPDYDNDGDTILDVDDACPNEAEDFDGFEDLDGCPDFDNDGDGVLDADDACVDIPGLPELMGCPDTDGDGLTDALDQCPTDPGPAELFGCPDRDADGVPDFRDACPDTPRSPDEPLASSNGCPTKAFVQGDRITITEKVLFETGKATIRPESFGLLDDVVAAMRSTPQIRSVEIAGHTDNVGNARLNLGLSDRRATAVKDYLLRKGIDRDRLTSRGYGMDQPIDSNLTDTGRERNRRVEFRIVAQDPISEQVDVRLGLDVGGVNVLLPTDRPFARVEVDGALASPRAPFRGLIVAPGTREIRVVDPRRGLDYRQTVQVQGGSTVTVKVPESAISRPYTETGIGPIPETSPMAIPKRDEGADRALPAIAPSAPTAPAPAPAPPPPTAAPSAPAAPPTAPTAPPPTARPVAPATEPVLPTLPDFGERVDDSPARRRYVDPDTVPLPQAEPIREIPLTTPDAPATGTVAGPGFGTPVGGDVAGPGFGTPAGGDIAGPGFGAPIDPKEARRLEKESAKAAKQAEKARRKAPAPDPAAPPLDDPAPPGAPQ